MFPWSEFLHLSHLDQTDPQDICSRYSPPVHSGLVRGSGRQNQSGLSDSLKRQSDNDNNTSDFFPSNRYLSCDHLVAHGALTWDRSEGFKSLHLDPLKNGCGMMIPYLKGLNVR